MRRLVATFTFFFSLTLAQQCSSPISQRIDCYPEGSVTPTSCTDRGCCWLPDESPDAPTGIPWCFYPDDFGYSGSNFVTRGNKITADLKKNANQPGPFGADITPLKLEVTMLEETIRFQIYDPRNARWEVPWVLDDGGVDRAEPFSEAQSDYSVSWTASPFGLAVTRVSTGSVIWNTTLAGFVFEDQFIQISTTIPQGVSIYGIGEHVEPIRQDLNYNTQTGFACDQGTPTGGTNLYGSHPFFTAVEADGNSYGAYLLNSNAMDIVLQPSAITYRTIGGILDFFIFVGPTPGEVVEQYTAIVGRSFLPPYWSLGFHLCRWGYNSVNNTQHTVEMMREYGIPQDVQWNDIDYMDRWLDFTLDPVNYAPVKMAAFIDDLHQHGQRYVMITDPGISNQQPKGSYPPYDKGLAAKVFINATDGTPYEGVVWPGKTVFPDFFHPNSGQWWQDNIQRFHDVIQFDGLWIDMNEPSNFIDNNCNATNNTVFNPNHPPYLPHIARGYLDAKTVCMNALQYNTIHYNVHNLFGLGEARATMAGLKEVRGKRTIVISRSTFASSGRHGGHWLGDNESTWADLYYSIPGILNMNMFGVTLVGADICGFGGPATTEELCTRWMQLGAFYPFSRNHNAIGKASQEPYVWGNVTAGYMRDVLLMRYSVLPYMYTLFYESHAFGRTVVRPLVFEYPKDPLVRGIDQQFLVGPALLVSPVLTQGATSVSAYFPDDTWYDFRTGARVAQAGYVTLNAPISYIPLHIRGGFVLPRQSPSTTTVASRLNPYHLVVALKNGNAAGTLYLDDGESLNSYDDSIFNLIKYSAVGSADGSSGTLSSLIAQYKWTESIPNLETIAFYGVAKTQTIPSVVVNGQATSSFTYNAATQVLQVSQLDLNMKNAFSIKWSV